METSIFRELGFTERETKVYLALLELGSSTVGPVSAKAGLQHTKVYETLEKLMRKGLVSYIVVSKTKHFQAANPKEILRFLDERKRKFAELLPELEIRKGNERQVAIIHKGFKAVKAFLFDVVERLNKGDEYCAFAFREPYLETSAPVLLRNVHRALAEKKVIDKILGSFEVKKEIQETFKDNKNVQLRFINRSTPLGCVLIKDSVTQMTWGEMPIAVEIRSSQIYKQYKAFFDELWKEASGS